ncbi:aprataxin and PNK-like factor [Morone saxatilis]|uniref:aprataxin and PNK-like factor n=1 Tax=Morone saxatilis TaxID=34816 RepID=UPI0015E22B35|nr:aprataxin and PNK-like factor [Morone saxatilis]
MSGFELVPEDGGDPIHLPPGETVLGRGPFLRVSDKRVSRQHGLLENLNGQLRLKPTHLNPCFVQSSRTEDPRPLQKDSWHPLRHGDLISLLPGQLIYRVVAVGGEDRTPRNSQMFEDEEELPVSPEPDVEPPTGQDRGQTPPTPAAPSNQEDADRSQNKRDSVQSKEEEEEDEVTPSVRRRRVLPAWMMAAVAAPQASSSSPKVQSAVKRTKGASAASTGTKRAAATQSKTSSAEEVGVSEEEMPKKRRRKISDEKEEEAQSKTDVPSQRPAVRPQSESNRPEVSDESDGFTMDVDEEGRGGGTSTSACAVSQPEEEDSRSRNGQQSKRAESVGSNSGSTSGPAPSKPRLRTACPYGKDCYRKNPVHFQECSHPGDTDYEEDEDEDEEEERPECPYGTDCYRKNPLHRKEFKHTKKPARTTRTAPNKTSADDEDEDFGDDDSFINDDSEDVGDDSDYEPPDSDEDFKGLQREAKALLKRRK